MKVIALSGKRGVGKDALAALLLEDGRFARRSFADESKRLLAEEAPDLDLDRMRLDREYKERWRPQLTALTERELARDPLVFVRRALRGGEETPLLVVDVRLRVEFEHLRSAGGALMVRVNCADGPRAARGWVRDPVKDAHFTECELDDAKFDIVVDNGGTFAELEVECRRVLRAYSGP